MEPYLLLAALIIALVYLNLVRWIYRLSPEEHAALQAKYATSLGKRTLVKGLLSVVVGVGLVLFIIGVSFWSGIYLGKRIHDVVKAEYWLSENALVVVEPSWFVIHITVGFVTFIGLILAGIVACSLVARQSIHDYLELDGASAALGSKPVPVLIWTLTPTVMLLCALLVLACDNFATVSRERIVLNEFWGIGSVVHSHREVAAIERTVVKRNDEGKEREIPIWKLTFSDGSEWSTQSKIAMEVNAVQLLAHENLARIVSERSGRPIVNADPAK
jgi:hypothetical protein